MDTSNYPEYGNSQPKKDSRNTIIGVFAVLLVGSLGYGIYNNSHHNNIEQTQQAQITKTVDEKGTLQRNFDDALVRLDSLTGSTNKLQSTLADKDKEIAKTKTEIRRILSKQNISEAEKKKAQALIVELNQRITNMEEEVARLTQDNKNLNEDKTKLTVEKEQLTSDLSTTTAAKEALDKKVDVASTFNASNIMITPVQLKKNGEEKVTTKAKKVDELKISFDVSNRIAANAQADVYVCITGPDGKLISAPENGSGTFTTREEGDKAFTAKLPVEFEAGKVKPVQFVWKQASGFEKGMYNIAIYHNGFKIGEATKELKKGGLF
ncbi:MAG: hypothetical protein JST75_11565 [Bacteroidetes bacterium]|nr:hypothetical protein [Bacteroidota bacterium]